jgi:hypothetical protein
MFQVNSSDLDTVEYIGIFAFLLFAVVHETVPNLEGAFVKFLGQGFHLPPFGRVFMKSRFFVARPTIETTNPLCDVNLVDGPCIKKHFGNLVDLFETYKDPSYGKQFCGLYLESLKVSYIVSFGGV